MRGQAVLIGALVLVCGWLGYRQYALESRLVALGQQLGAASEAGAHAPAAEPQGEDLRLHSHADRLAVLEKELRALRAAQRSLAKAPAGDAQPVNDQQILAVMRQQGDKVMDAQLKFHRERWLEQRETQLNDFARSFGLTQQENDQLWDLLADETDKIVELMRRPDLAENPERAAALFKELLMDTDAAAHRILDPHKAAAWDQGRSFERKVLWPWLPQ
jgi:hypothetical protein